MVKTQVKKRSERQTSTRPSKEAGKRFAPNKESRENSRKKVQQISKPIVVIGAGVNGSAIAMELQRELVAQGSKQKVILVDLYGYPNPHSIDNSSRGDTRITRMSNAEHIALTHTAMDTARFYTEEMRKINAGKNETDRRIRSMLNGHYEGTMLYNPHGFVLSMPRVKKSAKFHGHGNEGGNAYDRTLRNAVANDVRHEKFDGHEFAKRFPGFKIAPEDRDITDVYYEPQCLETDERKDGWFPTGGTLYAERCVALHLARFEAMGGEFRPHTEVTSVQSEGRNRKVTLAGGSVIEASKVVIAANKEANPFLPTGMLGVKAQRNVVGFFKGKNMPALSSDGPNPLPSFIIYFRTSETEADYAYGIPATKHSILYKDFFKAAQENGFYGDTNLKRILRGELNKLFDFTSNFANINYRRETRGLVCFYGVSKLVGFDGEEHNAVQVWSKHPFMPGCYLVHNCDGGGFKHAAGAARQFARMILDEEPTNPNIDLARDFNLVRGLVPVIDDTPPELKAMIERMADNPLIVKNLKKGSRTSSVKGGAKTAQRTAAIVRKKAVKKVAKPATKAKNVAPRPSR